MSKITISRQEVERIAKLSRLGLTDEEISQAAKDLGGVLGHFSEIQKINTTGVKTSDDVTGLTNVTRDDEATSESLCSAQTLLGNAPDTHQGQVKVKAVFE